MRTPRIESLKKTRAEDLYEIKDGILKSLSKMRGKAKMYVPSYSESLNPKELIDWVREMEK